MPTEIDTLDKVPEAKIKKLMKDFAQDGASMVTVINDGTGTFTVEATFPDGGLHAIVTKSGKMSTFGGPRRHRCHTGAKAFHCMMHRKLRQTLVSSWQPNLPAQRDWRDG